MKTLLLLLALLTLSASASPLRVACLGDSITQGAKVNAATESYPAVLQKNLGPDYLVRNFGKGGASMMRRGKPNAFQQLPDAKAFLPHVIIVGFGINDTRSRDVNYWAGIADFPGDARALLDDLLALPTGPRVLLCLPTTNLADLPGMTDDRKANIAERLPRLAEVRQKIRDLAAQLSAEKKNIALVDLEAPTRGKPELFDVDGVHLKPAGYAALAETLAPHIRRAAQTPDGGSISRGPERTLDAIEKTYAAMKPIAFTPLPDRHARLPATVAKLKSGQPLRVVMLGDSIINDTARSCFNLLLDRDLAPARIKKIVSVRGSTGCWFYKEPGRVRTFVTDHAPDLVIIGGISHKDDTDAIRSVISQIRADSRAEILLMTGPFGRVDPHDEKTWAEIQTPPAGSYRQKLPALATELGTAFFDLQLEWGNYVRASGEKNDAFHRDPIHANERGEQILGRLLAAWLTPL